MASKGALLRNIRPSGGLFTENILLRLRDNPNQLKIGKIDSFLEEDTKEERKKLTEKKQIIFDWCIQKWDEISPNIEEWSIVDLAKKWLIPLFTLFDHEIEDFEINKENLHEDSILKEFRISYQSRDHRDPFFHYVSINEDFDSKIDRNPQKKSHHNVCQQFINFNPEIKWLFLSNGRILRILTKYYHSYSKGYLEFDLENIFANRDEREFDTLYSIIHMSRFIPDYEDHKFLIDVFQKDSITEGIKIGDILRDNVEHALGLLGNELIQQNLDKIDLDEIDVNEFYAELLRIIYRIIFILYAEQRGMLPGAGSLYFEQFSLSSLRIRAEKPIKAEKNYDLWNKMLITFNLVRDGNFLLGVNSYNGSLFKEDNLRIILKNGIKISNDIVLKVIRLLTTSANHKVRQRINFLEVSEEEIGAIYESLLDFKPYISSTSQFQLIEGTERKSTGSYYTPKALIDILIRTTLQPLVEDRLIKAGDDDHAREKAILDLKVCDPACGGGTFLLSALDYLGKKLAEIRTGSDSPLEDILRRARRDILQHCIYGVDMNPLAVELAKISLWLRACVKDKPLNFLDNHIKCGNSLIGLGQKMDINKIIPEAIEAIAGNKATGIPSENRSLRSKAREIIKKEIREMEKEGKKTLITSFFTERRTADICSMKFKEIINMPETNQDNIKEKERMYKNVKKNENYQQALNEANIWTSTFFWSFEGESLGEIPRYTTIEQLRDKIADPELNNLMEKINVISEKYRFFHWYIEFPEVFSSERNGFDCILTNPPWDLLDLNENEFFHGTQSGISEAPNQSERRKLIKSLKKTNPVLFNKYNEAWIHIKKSSHYLKSSGFYDLSVRGKINKYQLFVERAWNLINKNGYIGVICPTGIIMNYFLKDLFKQFVRNKSIISLFDFENKEKIFDIHRQFRFCLLTLGGKNIEQELIPMTFYATDPIQIQEPLSLILENKTELKNKYKSKPDYDTLILLNQSDFTLFNPNTLTCPSFRSKKEALLLRHLYNQAEILIKKDEGGKILSNPWEIKLFSIFNMSTDSNLFITKKKLKEAGAFPLNKVIEGGIWITTGGRKFIPLYEGKMIWLYDHRYNTVEFGTGIQHKSMPVNKLQHMNPEFEVIPIYWVEERNLLEKTLKHQNYEWYIGFRDTTGATDKRTCISTIIPRYGAVNTLSLITSKLDPQSVIPLFANLNSIVFDYIARRKIPKNHMNFYVVEQLPIIPLSKYSKELIKMVQDHVLELVYTSYSLNSFALDLGYNGKPFSWQPERRARIQAELDAIYSHLYKLNRSDLEYIIETFFVLKEDELKVFFEFRTKKLILEAYDRFSKQKELFE
ncbi:MAG TPA: hypothetical protein ENH75_06090 [archaeon]|nr:hypothetical protein [archaeon]